MHFSTSENIICDRTMRQFVPPNVTKTSLKAMIALGIPSDVAERIWNKKILWFICMHPEDLPKVSGRPKSYYSLMLFHELNHMSLCCIHATCRSILVI